MLVYKWAEVWLVLAQPLEGPTSIGMLYKLVSPWRRGHSPSMAVSSDAYAELHGRVYRYVDNRAIHVQVAARRRQHEATVDRRLGRVLKRAV